MSSMGMAAGSILTVYLEDQVYGLDIACISEITTGVLTTPVPLASAYLCGLTNLRGQIVSVIDLKSRLAMGIAACGETQHYVILKTEPERLAASGAKIGKKPLLPLADKVGLMVDAVGEVLPVDWEELVPFPANGDQVTERFTLGAVKRENQVIAMLDIEKIVEDFVLAAAPKMAVPE